MNGLVLMTALPPTVGHKALIEFAANHMRASEGVGSKVYVIVSTRSFEPITRERVRAIEDQFANNQYVEVLHHADDNAPQNPKGDDDRAFWEYWRSTIVNFTHKGGKIGYVYASEPYGQKVADVIGANFIPYDIARHVQNVKGTNVRASLYDNFDLLMPTMQKHAQMVVTIFGAESVGKTTVAKALADELGGVFVPEWARPYLETHKDGVQVTSQKMNDIVFGQYANQMTARNLPKRLIVQDTDLYSTLGYYQIFKSPPNQKLEVLAHNTRSHLYIVLGSNIPFEPDPLRYGDGVRESDDQFWVNLLTDHYCRFEYIQTSDHEERMDQIKKVIRTVILEREERFRNFVRE